MSELGFGCVALLGRASLKESQRAVGSALDQGITFFDTARSYGHGKGEGLLGNMLAGRREGVVLSTKVGILPRTPGAWKLRLEPLVRLGRRALPAGRHAVHERQEELTGGRFSVQALTASFETSLRELRTDYVDLLLLHSAPASVLAQDDLLAALARLVEQGKAHRVGLAAEPPVISTFFAARPPVLTTAQFPMGLAQMNFASEAKRHGDLLLVANHPFGPAGSNSAAQISALRGVPALGSNIRGKLSIGDGQLVPEVLLNCILRGTGVSAVVVPMLEPRQIAGNVRAVERCRFTEDELAEMRTAFAGRNATG